MHEPLPAYSYTTNFPDLPWKEQEQKAQLVFQLVISFPFFSSFRISASKIRKISKMDIGFMFVADKKLGLYGKNQRNPAFFRHVAGF